MKKNLKNFNYKFFKNIALLSSLGICVACNSNSVNKHNQENVKQGSSKDDDEEDTPTDLENNDEENTDETNHAGERENNNVITLGDKRIPIEQGSEEEVENLKILNNFRSQRAICLKYTHSLEIDNLKNLYVFDDFFVFQIISDDTVALVCIDVKEDFEADNIDVPENVRIKNKTYFVTRIGNNACINCKSIKHVNLPSSVNKIGDFAFCGCENLQSISFYEIEKIVVSDGNNDSELQELKNRASDICDTFFSDLNDELKLEQLQDAASEISKIKFENSKNTLEIGKYAFYDCINLTSISLQNEITEIGEHAFYCCKSLESIPPLKGINKISDSAFEYCTILTEISLPEGLAEIGCSAFGHCKNLKSISLPEGLNKIGRYAFEKCKSLKSISLPEGLVKIDYSIFQDSGLKTIFIPASVEKFDFLIYTLNSLKNIFLKRGGHLTREDVKNVFYSRRDISVEYSDSY